ncbi:MAG: hypothetical protein WCL27_06325 [Betaproteobacteria bacterium]
MDVSSVSSSVNSTLIAATTANTQSQTRTRQTEQDKQAQQSQQTQQSQQAETTQKARKSQAVVENEATSNARPETEKSRPSVNTNGQVVGTRVNTTA